MLPGIAGTLLAPTFVERIVNDLVCSRNWRAELRPVHQWWRRADRTLGPASSVRAIADTAAIPFFEARDYRVLQLEPYANGLLGTLTRDGRTRVVLRVTTWGSDVDREWRETVLAGRAVGSRWGIIFTGNTLRLVDAQRCWARRALDFDLASVMADERSAVALLALVDAAGMAHGEGSLETFIARSEQYGVDVCASLGTGVLEALTALFSAFEHAGRRRLSNREAFEQSVTIVYRLLFLLFAEARAMVPIWHQVYRDAYTIESLCRRALTQPWRRGFWKTLQAISRLAHHGCRAGDLVVTPFNGRLFSPRQTPLAERARVPDEAVRRAVMALATTTRREVSERIAYADLGVEQLGAVYERVLEYEPSGAPTTRTISRTSHDRKATGSFYTPRSVTDFLVRRALHPLVQGKNADALLNLRVLDPAMGSGAFLVSACRYLSDAVERALVNEGTITREHNRAERMEIRRQVAQRCLFGVDLNPMAVQLARLSLWLASLSADRPLTFLDHHLMTGDSLSGASLADLVREPLAVRPRRPPLPSLPLFEADAASQFSQAVLPERFRIAHEPGNTPAAVRAKERALAQLTAPGSPLARWKDAAHLWCAAWFWGETSRATDACPELTNGVYHDILAALTGRGATLPLQHRAAVLARARALATTQQFFHWELEFPEVFFAADGNRDPAGGFDVVIGNPPWDVLRADTGDRARRDRAREDHRAKLRFFRDSRIYRYQGRGHANRYQLFLERALQLARPGGRLALIAPSGLASDQGSAALRRALFESTSVERVFGFDNRAGIFPIHRDVRFLLLTATKGPSSDRLTCAFGHSGVEWLEQLPDAAADDPPPARRISIARTTLASWDPQHVSIPWLTQAQDYAIMSLAAGTVMSLSDPRGWHVTFGRELNATDDRTHFVPRERVDAPSLLPIVEGKHLEPFRALTAVSTLAIPAARAATLVDPTRTYRRARLAYRDVASATNRLTLIAARLPPGTISTHTVFCAKDTLGADAQYCLLALLNSLVANYLVRLRVTTHVTAAVMARLPVPRPSGDAAAFRELAALARELERTGIAGQDDVYARLNALAAHLYGLTSDQYRHVVSTFPLLPADLRARVVAAYEATEAAKPKKPKKPQRSQRAQRAPRAQR